uniref:NtCtMGAM_N domain-containing protein n=1 Tax=Anisakis simplex TaxID=6269 RepID=A0A158PNX2_ANISI
LPLNTGYEVDRVTGDTVFMKKTKAGALNGYDVDMPLRFTHERYGAALNLRITGRENTRFFPYSQFYYDHYSICQPLQYRFKTRDYVIFAHGKSVSSDELIVEVSKSKFFYFVVKRKSTGTVIWDTSIGGMMFADKFIQIATKLPSTKLYGFGENIHQTLKHDFTNYTTWGMFARDEFPNSAEKDGKNLYGVHGFYLALEPDNKAHGVLILNSNAQEVTTMPGPALVYRTIGGMLDIFFFPGPTPEEVIQQYTTFIGKPTLPAYFSLGFQLCRYGYKDLNELKSVVSEVKEAKIPLDVVYADIEYMHRYNDFTVGEKWNGFGEYIRDLKVEGKRTILIFDCGIRADDDAFVRAIDQIMLAVVWPDGHTAFPDFYDRTGKTTKWWIKEFVNFHEKLEFDGIWIDMNEPAAFGTNEQYPWYFNYADHPNITSLKCPLIGDDSRYDNPPFKTFNVYRYGDNAHDFLGSRYAS